MREDEACPTKQSYLWQEDNEAYVSLLRGVYTDWRSRVEVLAITEPRVYL